MILAFDFVSIFVGGLRDAVAVPACIYAVAAIGLNIQFGYAGLMNFGHIGSALVGAYGTAISVDHGIPLAGAIGIGMAAAFVLGLLLGLPTLRLRADYLAIATISAAEILRVLANSNRLQDLTGGPIGINDAADGFYSTNPIPSGRYGWGAFGFNEDKLWTIIIGWTLVVILTLVSRRLARSPWGRVLKGVREDEEATTSLGKNVFLAKLQALVIGSVIAGISGVLFVFDGGFVSPSFFISQVTFNWYLVLILGGIGTLLGPPVGAMVYWFVISIFNASLAELLGDDGWWFVEPNDAGALRFVLVGLTIVLLLAFRPQGIFGNKEEAIVRDR